MAFGGDVDTLSLTFDKLQYIFRGYDQIRESFLEQVKAHKNGAFSDTDYYWAVEDSVRKFSALEFLAIKAIFEIKKASDRGTGVVKMDEIMSPSGQGTQAGPSIASFISAGTLPRAEIYGKKQDQHTCKACGRGLRPNATFCSSCGSKQK